MAKRTVGILLFDDVEVLDFAGPYEVFSRTRTVPGTQSRRTEESAPFNVFTVAERSGAVVATGGLRVVPDYCLDDHPHIDVVVVPGGFGTRPILDRAEILDWIRGVAERAEIVTSVCTGALLLAASGLLASRRATTHWGALSELKRFEGVTVEAESRFVSDGHLITSAGVASGIDMAFHVVERLCGREVADETAHYIMHGTEA